MKNRLTDSEAIKELHSKTQTDFIVCHVFHILSGFVRSKPVYHPQLPAARLTFWRTCWQHTHTHTMTHTYRQCPFTLTPARQHAGRNSLWHLLRLRVQHDKKLWEKYSSQCKQNPCFLFLTRILQDILKPEEFYSHKLHRIFLYWCWVAINSHLQGSIFSHTTDTGCFLTPLFCIAIWIFYQCWSTFLSRLSHSFISDKLQSQEIKRLKLDQITFHRVLNLPLALTQGLLDHLCSKSCGRCLLSS